MLQDLVRNESIFGLKTAPSPTSKHVPISQELIHATAVSLLPLHTDSKYKTHNQSHGFHSVCEGRIWEGFLLTRLPGGNYRGCSLTKSVFLSHSWVSQQAGEDCASNVTLHMISVLYPDAELRTSLYPFALIFSVLSLIPPLC